MSHRLGLDRAAVVQAAAVLADREGIEQLTLAALAARLGVRIPSLYNYVDGLHGLRRALALLGTHELSRRLERAAVGRSADVAVQALAHAYRTFAHERPGLYAAALRAPDPDDAEHAQLAAETITIVRAVLDAYELSADACRDAVRGLRSLAHGFVSLEAVGGFGQAPDLDESYRQLIALFIDGLHGRRHEDGAETPVEC